jgi:tetratricopeptide (TPR) repeat protein
VGKDYLITDSNSVQFDPASPFWLDVIEFEKRVNNDAAKPADLAAAVELYRGDLLEGFYDDWCIEERYRLESLYLKALRRLMDWHEAHGDAREVLAYAQKYLARDPLMEDVHIAAMRSFVTLGDLAGARRQWQICCETRQHELHAPPSSEMLQQAENLLGAYFTIPLSIEPRPVKTSPQWEVIERLPFVGREREMEALQARWEQGVQGRGGMIIISGEAGVGKTRLAEEFTAVVRRRGGMVARGRCFEPERVLPHQLLTEMLQDLTRQVRHASLDLPAWARVELVRLVPEMVASSDGPVPPSVSQEQEQQAILYHAIATLIRKFSTHAPLLIVLEDLHWAAESTLAAIYYLLRQTVDVRVLYLITLRPEDVSQPHALSRIMAQLAHEGLAQHIALERLSMEAIAELVRCTIKTEADTEFVKHLYAHTEGNAFFVIETLRALAEAPLPEGALPLPGNVRSLIASRLGVLSAAAHEWITCAAVAGRAFDFDLVCHAEGMDEETALQAVDELLQRGFLREGSRGIEHDYEFVHYLVQSVTYAAIHRRRRQRLHRLIGETMERLYADPGKNAGVLAHHFDIGGVAEKAIHYYAVAAQQAAAVFAWQEAERHQGRMLHLLEQLDPDCTRADCLQRRQQVLADRALARFLQARLAERDADLAALDALAEASGDARVRLQALSQRARYLNLDAQYEKAIAVAEEGLPLADHLHDMAARCYLLTQIGFAHYFLGQPQPALIALESALEMTPETDLETQRHITHILSYVHFHLGNYARSVAYLQASYTDHHASGDCNGMVWAGLDIGAAYREMGRLTEAEQYLTEHLHLAQRIGARSAEAYGLIQLGSWELCRGNYATALDLFQQAISTQQGLRTEHGQVAAELGLGFAFYHLGDTMEARRRLEQAVQRARLIRHRRRLAEALIGLGLVALAAGQSQSAYGYLTEAVAVARESESRRNLAVGLAALARAERCLGDLMMALGHASEAVQISSEITAVGCEMWGELERGLVRLAQGDPESALEHTRHALELLSQSNESWIGSEQVHRVHARVLRALACVDAADEQERQADAIIAAKAGRIPDAQQRQRYLEYTRCNP